MTTRHRTTSSSRKDYGLWRPSDGSDSDRPRQTMANTQRHSVDQTLVVEAHRKHRSSRRPDPAELLDPSAAYSRHKSSSKDRSSTTNQASYYIVPPSPNPSAQHQTNTAHYDLRAYLKQKTEKRSPGSSNEKGLASDEGKPSRSGHRSRHAYPDQAAYSAAIAPTQSYVIPSAQATRDPTSSSRHHRERDKDREKASTRDPERVRAQDPSTERSEDRERRRRREKDGEKDRSSKDKERHKEKERRKDREGRVAAEARPANAASVHQAYAQTAAVAQRPVDKASAPYPNIVRPPSTQPQATAHAPLSGPTSAPWAGLTSAGRGAGASVPESIYPYASDKDDPPLPIPPPTRRRTSSKPHRSHKATSQQAGQDSGLSSSEQEHERPRTTDRHYASREQASNSILQRGYSSGPSGSENEKVPTIQMERVRKHRTHGESSRNKSKTANVDAQPAIEPTTSQEIATLWYQRHQRDPSSSRMRAPTSADPSAQKSLIGLPASAMPAHTFVPPSGKPTPSVGLTVSQRAPQIVSIRAGQGPADPHAPLPKVIHSGVTPLRQPDPLPSQQYQSAAARQQDGSLQAPSQGHTTAYAEASPGHHHSSITQGASGSYQQPGQSYPNTMHTRTSFETNGVSSTALRGNQPVVPDVVVRPPSTRPPSAAPVPMDPYSRARSTSVSVGQPAAYTQQQVQGLSEADAYRSGTYTRGLSQDLPSRFPVYEDTTSASQLSPSGAPHMPSASPKRGLTYPGASAPAHPSTVHVNPSNQYGSGTYDPRSPKPPSVQTITNEPSRLQTYLSGSPAVVPHTVSAGSSTPKHSSSVRLQSHRNGSNDTITHAAPTKSSPSGSSQQHLPHRPSAVNMQPQLHASSRLDAGTASRQPNASSAYPDIHRYRSPAPQAQGYPNAHASSSAPVNVTAPINSPSYSTQTPLTTNDYQQYGRTAATPTQATFATQAQARSRQSVDYGYRPPEQILATNPLASPAPTAQRIPLRATPSLAPTGRPTRLISTLSSKVSAPLHSAPARNQTFPNPGSSYSTTTPFPIAHSRTVSDPQYTDRATAGYVSASLPTRGHKAASQQQQDILLTPSSLAPSMLPQTSAPLIPLDRSTSKNTINGKDNEKEKKRSFFGSLFRSRSSPPKPRDEPAPPPSQQITERRERNNSQPTQPMSYMQVPTVAGGASKSSSGPRPPSPRAAVAAPASMRVPPSAPAPAHQRGYSTSAVPKTVPIAQPAPVSLTRNSNGKMFTPFRLLSKRHRTVSTASVDAVDGTVINAMLTGGDSTRSSTAGRPSPPLRDPMTAAQEWRNQEEVVQQVRGTLRRRRPGVTFDVGDEVPEDGRPSLQKSLRANLAAMAAAQGQIPAQAQGQQQRQQQQQQAVQVHQTYQAQAAQHKAQGYPAQASYSQGQPLPTRGATA
ncbi:hypothetical protein LXA43DRAFT_989480 [Ganoderma leucocontextum]|nr:hypothetical protein LXA43DRAFT_989480 [Ganoderma leucocontextum]